MQRHLCFTNRAGGWEDYTAREILSYKSTSQRLYCSDSDGYHRFMFYNVCYITDSYSNIPVDLHKAVENSKKLLLATAKEQINTPSNHLTNNA